MTFWIYVTEDASRKDEEMAPWQYRKKYVEVNQEIRRKMKQAKENWITNQCQEIDSGIRIGHTKAAFNTLKLLTQRQQTKLIENTKGKI